MLTNLQPCKEKKKKRETGKNKTNNNKKPTFTAPVEQYILKHMKKVLQLAINDPRTKLHHFWKGENSKAGLSKDLLIIIINIMQQVC